MVFAAVRFWANGWIHELYIAPEHHFTYHGFGWVRPWPGWGMHAHFFVMGLAALGIMLGAWARFSAALFFVTFTYAELIDKTTYLNHYYLVSLLALLMVLVPSGAIWSIDAWRKPERASASVGRWAYILLRAQVALVYIFAGLAKLCGDWLLRAEPLQTWLPAFADMPLVGAFITEPWAAYAMSWGGAFYDLTIVGWLLWKPTRSWAYCVSIFFHVMIWILFPVGMFSWIMLVAATVFFDPAWPRRITGAFDKAFGRQPARQLARSEAQRHRLARSIAWLAVLYLVVQVLVPLRFLLYPGNVMWTEEGFRLAWRVMLIEKTGQVEYEVRAGEDDRRYVVYPRSELTPLQHKMMSTQPDMIHEYALEIAERFRRDGHRQVRVYAHAWAALNGRPSQRLIDPTVDLASQSRSLRAKAWIVKLQPAESR